MSATTEFVPLLHWRTECDLAIHATNAKHHAFRVATREVALQEIKRLKAIVLVNLDEILENFKAILTVTGGKVGEAFVEERFSHWSPYAPITTEFLDTEDTSHTQTLLSALLTHPIKSDTLPCEEIPYGYIFKHKLYKESGLLDVLAALISPNVEIRVEKMFRQPKEALHGILDGQTVLLAENWTYVLKAVYHPQGLRDYKKKRQEEALAFYGFVLTGSVPPQPAEPPKEAAEGAGVARVAKEISASADYGSPILGNDEDSETELCYCPEHEPWRICYCFDKYE